MSENSGIGRIEDESLKFPANLLTTCQDSNYSDSELAKHSKDTYNEKRKKKKDIPLLQL